MAFLRNSNLIYVKISRMARPLMTSKQIWENAFPKDVKT